MKEKELIERVAAGLRAMKIEPDALIILNFHLDFYIDKKSICGIPVFYSTNLKNIITDEDVCVMPLFKLNEEGGHHL